MDAILCIFLSFSKIHHFCNNFTTDSKQLYIVATKDSKSIMIHVSRIIGNSTHLEQIHHTLKRT